jgi:hypothetical protein
MMKFYPVELVNARDCSHPSNELCIEHPLTENSSATDLNFKRGVLGGFFFEGRGPSRRLPASQRPVFCA